MPNQALLGLKFLAASLFKFEIMGVICEISVHSVLARQMKGM